MPRLQSCWTPEGPEPINVANSRVCLVLLRIFRDVPMGIEPREFDDVVKPFWPILRLERKLVQAGLRASRHRVSVSGLSRQRRGRAATPSDLPEGLPAWFTFLSTTRTALPVEPPDPDALTLLGEGMVCDLPAFRDLYDAVEARLESHIGSRQLPRDQNLLRLAELLQLEDAEQRVLALCAEVEASTIDRQLFSHASRYARRIQALRVGLGLDSDREAGRAASAASGLRRAGLLQERDSADADLEDVLRLTRMGSQLLAGDFATHEAMAAHVLRPLPKAVGAAHLHWGHLKTRTSLVEDLLRGASREGTAGINLLLYGAPGTGKTAYVRQLLDALGAPGYIVTDRDDKQMPASRSERLGSLQLGDIFAPAGSVMVLDEAEDVFQTDYANPLRRSLGQREDSKSWMNQLLENNRLPVIWISNQIDHIDPAYLRRFTYCMEFPTPPRALRREIARSHLSGVGASDELLDAVASQADLSPALVANAARVVSMAGRETGSADSTARLVLGDHMQALGEKFATPTATGVLRFDPRYLRVEGKTTADQLLDGLRRTGRGTVLLAGPPGTGKTQLAGQIARDLGRELVYRTASDINSMWYGQSERNVARLFTDCDAQAEVLFLDEAETLLGERGAAPHRADAAVTAEFLRRIESFTGVFVCATNHASAFDGAMSRRFMFRMNFLPLDAIQRVRMLEECVSGQSKDDALPGLIALSTQQAMTLQRLDQLTPGDFANVSRRLRALGINANAEEWLLELQEEHRAKPDGSRTGIGFV
jgi:transitional endoplasmic reticulum ATPase